MATQGMSWFWGPRSIWAVLSQARLAIRLLREPRVPISIKAMPLFAVLYLISPIDVLPDVLPLLGQIDDLGLILIAVAAFLRLCPAEAVAHHRAAIAARRRYTPMAITDTVINATWRRD